MEEERGKKKARREEGKEGKPEQLIQTRAIRTTRGSEG